MSDVIPWYDHRENLATLLSWMDENGIESSEMVHAVEKPWKYEDCWLAATLDLLSQNAGMDPFTHSDLMEMYAEDDYDYDDICDRLRAALKAFQK